MMRLCDSHVRWCIDVSLKNLVGLWIPSYAGDLYFLFIMLLLLGLLVGSITKNRFFGLWN